MNANFAKADMMNANFAKADMKNANFAKADMMNANFAKADMMNANFAKADTMNANFAEAVMMMRVNNIHFMKKVNIAASHMLINSYVKLLFFSSPEHEVLMVSYCDQSMSVVRRPSSTICFKS